MTGPYNTAARLKGNSMFYRLVQSHVRAAWLLAFLLAGTSLGPQHLQGQCVDDPGFGPGPGCGGASTDTPRWVGEARVLGINAAIGGLTAGVLRHARGESFWRGFLGGALGGGVSYGGKRISGERFRGAGFLGRETAAVGASIVQNAAESRGLLDQVILPVGPVRMYVDRTAKTPLRAKVDLAGLVSTAYAAAQPNSRLDIAASLSAGAPVFYLRPRYDGPTIHAGAHHAGVIRLRSESTSWSEVSRRQLILAQAHEQVHVAQYDFSFIVWSEPVERRLLSLVPGGDRMHRYVDLGLNVGAWAGLNALIDYEDRPWEKEATFLTTR